MVKVNGRVVSKVVVAEKKKNQLFDISEASVEKSKRERVKQQHLKRMKDEMSARVSNDDSMPADL
jgi:hypothetical protein